MPEKILIAVAWPYASGPRHLGHVSSIGVPPDIFARYHRLRGNEVLMVSGTDDHGTPITTEADREGISPAEVVRRYHDVIVGDLKNLGVTHDLFTQTSTANHHRVVQGLFSTLYEKGYIVARMSIGAISPSTGRTLPDRYLEGTCPICGFKDARGDQCENCGNQLDAVDLIDPRSKVNGEVPEFRETEHLYLELPAFADELRDWIAKQDQWRPNVRAFAANFVSELKPRAITRDIDWGVPIPLPRWKDLDMKRLYVWFDAVVGYLSASVEWASVHDDPDAWKRWWKDAGARHYYFMGKDNIIFHTIIWPAMLLGAGDLNLPYDIVATENLNMEGNKFSRSRRVGIWVGDFLSRYDPDPLRYYLAIAGPETQDTDFTWSEFVRRNNDELVGTWGNLVHRTLVNAHRNFGEVPPAGDLTPRDREVLAAVESGFDSVGELFDGARFKAGVTEAMRLAALVNQYLGEEQPWHTIKTDRERAGTVLHVALRCVDNLKVLFTPVLPFTSQRLHEMLGHDGVIAPQPEVREYVEDGRSHSVLAGEYAHEAAWKPTGLAAGQKLRTPQALYKKLDEKVVDEELARMEGAST
ncbi:methionine--tRNA ligase [bacterium]|nr:MAG: methionine--tRNA ligase [bacterium]